MKKELIFSIIAFVCFMTLFVAGILITEQMNYRALEKNYSAALENTPDNEVHIQAPSAEALSLQKNKVATWLIHLLLGMFIPGLILFTGISAGIRRWIEEMGVKSIFVIILYFLVYSLIEYLLTFPLDFYAGFVRPHAYGLSNQTFLKWLGDSLLSLGVSAALTGAVVWVPFLIIKKFPAFWWLVVGLLFIPYMFFMYYISPAYIDPLYNRYTPLEDRTLEAKINGQMNRTTIGSFDLYQVDKSTDTKEMNAYMTGVFDNKRIVLWDTTIQKLSDREILAIVAHEAGHYLLGHIWKSILLGGALCILVLFLVNKCALWVLARSGGAFGFDKLHDAAALPLLVLMISLFTFLSAPLTSAYSRAVETQADTFELELTKDNYASAMAMVRIHEQSKILPQPGILYKLWRYDHPTYKERVDFANTYRPWEQGKPLEYQKYFK